MLAYGAIAGKVIDFGVGSEFYLEQAIQESPLWEFAIEMPVEIVASLEVTDLFKKLIICNNIF